MYYCVKCVYNINDADRKKINLNLIKAFDNMYRIMKKSCFYVKKIFELRILLVSQQLAFNIHVYGKKNILSVVNNLY